MEKLLQGNIRARLLAGILVMLLAFVGSTAATPAYADDDEEGTPAPPNIDPALRRHVPYEKVRRALLKNGWKPVIATDKNADGELVSRIGEAEALYRAGFMEVERCGATGYCLFNFVRNGECLRIVTLGDYRKAHFPKIYSWRAECYRPE